MNRYTVTFRFETSVEVEVEAENDGEACDLAGEAMSQIEQDHLPEMWPEDFVVESVELCVPATVPVLTWGPA